MMIAFDAAASRTSVSVIAPTLGMQDANLHLVRAELVQHVRQSFLRALHVALQDQRHFLDFAFGQLLVQLVEREPRRLRQRDVAQLFLPV